MSVDKNEDEIRTKLNRLFRDKKLVRVTLGRLKECDLEEIDGHLRAIHDHRKRYMTTATERCER